MRPVTVQFGNLPRNFCPSNPTEFIQALNRIVRAYVNDDGDRVRIEFGFPIPPFCPSTADEFISGLNTVSRGYVESTGDTVVLFFSTPPEFCWTDPQALVNMLGQNYTAYVV